MQCRNADRIIGSNPEQEYGDNNYMQWARETLAAIDRDLRIDGTDSYYENQDRTQVSFIWGNIFLQYTYAEGAGLRADEWKGALMSCYQNLERHWSPDYKGIAGYCTLPGNGGHPRPLLRRERLDGHRAGKGIRADRRPDIPRKSPAGTEFHHVGRR